MSGWTLTLAQPPALRVELGGVLPEPLAALDAKAVAALPLMHGNETLSLGELFRIAPRADDDALVIEGDLSRFDCIGMALAGGELRVDGSVGDQLGRQMSGGTIAVSGSARHQAGVEMSGGRIEIAGDVGDFAAGALPGSLDGMRGGMLVVRGRAGDRFADRMRRGTAVVHGDAGDFVASRLVAGTIALGGGCGSHPAYGMRRGTIVYCGARPEPPPTFVPTTHDIASYWALLALDLRRQGGVFARLDPRAPPARHAGDLAVGGIGEWLFAAA